MHEILQYDIMICSKRYEQIESYIYLGKQTEVDTAHVTLKSWKETTWNIRFSQNKTETEVIFINRD